MRSPNVRWPIVPDAVPDPVCQVRGKQFMRDSQRLESRFLD
jgi:hypothetical protein